MSTHKMSATMSGTMSSSMSSKLSSTSRSSSSYKLTSTTPNTITPTHLQACYYGSPQVSYNKLMKSSTRLNPNRQPYVSLRMVNQVYGKEINRQLHQAYSAYNENVARRQEGLAKKYDDTRKQLLEAKIDNLRQLINQWNDESLFSFCWLKNTQSVTTYDKQE